MEIRSSNLAPSSEGNTLTGYIAVWGAVADVQDKQGVPYKETIKRGAFTEALQHDIPFLPNHDNSAFPLGRTSAGTLDLRQDEKGFAFTLTVDPSNPRGAEMLSAAKRGDIKGCSFGWNEGDEDVSLTKRSGKMTREVRQIRRLHHVSIVTNPAYQETSLTLRSAELPDLDNEHQRTLDRLRLIEQQNKDYKPDA